MRKWNVFGSCLLILFLTGCALRLPATNTKWELSKNRTNEYLESRYGEQFRYQAPARTYDVDGTGMVDEDTFYVKTVSKAYPEIGMFTNYVDTWGESGYTVRECYQSVKFSYLLGKDLAEAFPEKGFRVEVNGALEWEDSATDSPVYTNYTDYFNGKDSEPIIYLYLEENALTAHIKEDISEMILHVPHGVSGTLRIQIFTRGYGYPTLKMVPREYRLENWNNVDIPFFESKLDFENMAFGKWTGEDTVLYQYLTR